MTSDRASAAEAESSTAEYQCDIVGYVYNYSAPNTRSIEIDSGIAFVFSKKGAPTEPDVRTVGLYRHEAGYDYWYETHPSDTGFVGYLKP